MSVTVRTIEANGARLQSWLCGQGRIALLVHGYPLDHRMWRDLFARALPRVRTLCAVDLRGHGGSPWNGDDAHTMEAFADDLAAVVRTLSDEPVDVVGLSMGGYAALALAELHPGCMRSLALIDTRAAADTTEARAARQTTAQNVVQHGRRWLAEQLLPKLLAPGADLLVRARVQTMIEETPYETIVADLHGMMQRPDRRALLPQIRVPTLCVVGEHDALTPPSEMEAMAAAVPGARCVVVQGAGHMAPMENPDACERALASFWK
jgi:pimeloyl-ACP methyl ester carboxylesterase